MTLACVSNPIGGPYVGNALWQGVRLADIFAEVGVDPDVDAAAQHVGRRLDVRHAGVVADRRSQRDARRRDERRAVACRARLPGADGRARGVRLRVGDEVGRRHGTSRRGRPWTRTGCRAGWSQQAPMKTMTRIEAPDDSADVPPGRCEIAGTAYAVHRGISAVEVRIDGGDWVRGRARRRALARHVAQVGKSSWTSRPASTRSRPGPPTGSARCRPTRSPTSPPTAPAATTSCRLTAE